MAELVRAANTWHNGERLNRHRWRAGFAALVLTLLTMPASGCGGSEEDITTKSAGAILAASRAVADEASAVRVHSNISQGRLPFTIELHLAGREGGHARLVIANSTSEATRIGQTVYVKPSPAEYRRLARTGLHVPAGTWIQTQAGGSKLGAFGALTEPTTELAVLLADPSVSLTKGAVTTIHGTKAIELKTKGKLYTGAVYIAASGKPYPLEIVKHGRETGTVTFTGWNDPATITLPTNTVELSQLEHKSG